MRTNSFQDLGELRRSLVRLRIETAAAQSGLTVARLRELEGGDEPTVYELERLASAYGIEADTLFDVPIVLNAGDGVNLLASLDEFRDIDDLGRARILRAAAAARELVTLRRRLRDESPELLHLAAPSPSDAPFRQGAELAMELRREFGLGVDPIESVRDLFEQKLPAVSVLYADLTRQGPAGLGFADAFRGPAVVLNLVGKNEHPAVRRFSLCHELCHLVADWNRADPLASISGFFSETGLEREQRANAFAIRLLCPEAVVHDLRRLHAEDAARVLLRDYGLNYRATRLYLRNEAGIVLPELAPRALESFVEPDPSMVRREAPRGVEDFPIRLVPPERRGTFALAVVRAWSGALLSRDAAARHLGVSPSEPIERVADYFDVDLPAELSTG